MAFANTFTHTSFNSAEVEKLIKMFYTTQQTPQPSYMQNDCVVYAKVEKEVILTRRLIHNNVIIYHKFFFNLLFFSLSNTISRAAQCKQRIIVMHILYESAKNKNYIYRKIRQENEK